MWSGSAAGLGAAAGSSKVNWPPQTLPPASLTALCEAAAAINSTLDLPAVLQTIARLACEVTRAEASNVFSLDTRSKKLNIVAAFGHRREVLVGQEFDAYRGIPGHVLRSGEAAIVSDVRRDKRYCPQIDDIAVRRTTSVLATPMMYRSAAIGVIQVVNRLDEGEFSDNDRRILQVFATLAASAIQNARTHEELRRRYEVVHKSALGRTSIVGQTPQMRDVLDLCDRVAPSTATVLILGETGTGKEMTARYIHNASRRRDEPFIAINCAALPETLLESELFGHEKGSFTGAHQQRMGWFESAAGGTLFLDEIGEISRSTQAKLLRVLQEKEIVRVGGTKPVPCDVRLIAATNRNLKNMMVDGVFRDDLYYRLSVFPIRLPPLRERQPDIKLLIDHFVAKAVREFHIPELHVTAETLDALLRYAWPGNIRELQNVVERAVLMADGQRLLPCHLPPDIVASVAAETPDVNGNGEATTLYAQERALIERTLAEHHWNQSQAARVLGITRDHLRHRIKKYNLHKPADAGRAGGNEA